MKKNFICIFAHPDDEAFGPAGTIAQLAKKYNVYILCATKGHAGDDTFISADEKLHSRRAHELLESAQTLGVKGVEFLGLKDGCLCNLQYHKLAEKIEHYLKEYKPAEIMTFERLGISGHIDHITVSMATTFVFQKLPFVKKLWYYCLSKERSEVLGKDYFIYFPEGYSKKEVTKTVDVTDVWDTKLKAMQTHKSQKKDAEKILRRTKNFPKEECFIIKSK